MTQQSTVEEWEEQLDKQMLFEVLGPTQLTNVPRLKKFIKDLVQLAEQKAREEERDKIVLTIEQEYMQSKWDYITQEEKTKMQDLIDDIKNK